VGKAPGNKRAANFPAEHMRYTLRRALGLRFNTAELDGPVLREMPVANEPSLEEILKYAPIGSPERVAEVLLDDICVLRPSHLSCMMQFGGMPQQQTEACRCCARNWAISERSMGMTSPNIPWRRPPSDGEGQAQRPPSTGRQVPVTMEAASEASQSAAAAMSLGVTRRPSGISRPN